MQVKNYFNTGVVNTDSDYRFVKPDEVVYANNIEFFQNGNDGTASSIVGNSVISGGNLAYGSDYYYGHCVWKEMVYLFYGYATSSTVGGGYINEYDTLQGTYDLIVKGDLNMPIDLLTSSPNENERYVLSADVIDGVSIHWCGGLKNFSTIGTGDMSQYKAPLRINITDARANPTTYSNFTGDLDKPDKLEVGAGYDPDIKNNQLKFGSYIFYKRYINKYNEKTVLSYPSICVNVSEGSNYNVFDNYVNIAGFTVDDDIYSVEIFVSNNSDNTFTKIRDIDTSQKKYTLAYTLGSGTFTVGENITVTGASAGVYRIVSTTGSTSMVVSKVSGVLPLDTSTITGVTSGAIGTLSADNVAIDKTVSGFNFYNKNEGVILDAQSSDINNYEFPITATEQEVADNRIMYGDVDIYREALDDNGAIIDKSKKFTYTTTGTDSNLRYSFPYTLTGGTFEVGEQITFSGTSSGIHIVVSDNGSVMVVARVSGEIPLDTSAMLGAPSGATGTLTANATEQGYYEDSIYTGYIAIASPTPTPMAVTATFIEEETYIFSMNTSATVGGESVANLFAFEWDYDGESNADVATALNALFSSFNSNLSVTTDALTTGNIQFNLTHTGATTHTQRLVIENKIDTKGLNTLFKYKAGVVWLDDKGRHAGVFNVTPISHDNSTSMTFKTSTNISALTKPSWATKYMIVRDKINTDLSFATINTVPEISALYTAGGFGGATLYYQEVDTQLYTDYLSNYKGKEIILYSLALGKEINVRMMTDEEKPNETAALDVSKQYFYTDIYTQIERHSVVMFTPNKNVEANREVFYETSNVFNISTSAYGTTTYHGNGEILDWYDTKVGTVFAGSVGGQTYGTSRIAFPIMKTGTTDSTVVTKITTERKEGHELFQTLFNNESKFNKSIERTDESASGGSDINHLGRGVYTVSSDVVMDESSTIVYSQKYNPSVNYNGLNVFSSTLTNYLDLNKRYGRIVKLIEKDSYLLIGQRKKWSRIPLDKDVLTSAGGGESLTATNIFLNKQALTTYAGEYGITDKKSHASFGFRDYFVDHDNGVIIRLSQDGMTVINGSRDDEIRAWLKGLNRRYFLIGGYEPDSQQYLISDTSTGKTYKFSENNNNQSGEIDYGDSGNIQDYITVLNKFYTVRSNELYEAVAGSANTLYGSTVTNTLKYVVNHSPNVVKDFISMSLESNIACDVTIATAANTTTIDAEDFEKKEDVWYADIPKSAADRYDYGVGISLNSSITSVSVINPSNLRIGDILYANSAAIGYVTGFSPASPILTGTSKISVSNTDPNSITKPAIVQTPANIGDFVYTRRPSKTEGKSMKGQYALVTLSNDTGNALEVFSAQMTVNLSSNP